MKRLIMILLAFAFSHMCFPQGDTDKYRDSYIAVGIGPAIPVGQFRNSEIGNPKAGFAKTGLTLSAINVGYRFKWVELTALFMGSAHFLTLNTSDEDAAWVYRGIFIGSVIPQDISKRVRTGIKVMIGYFNATSPQVTVAGINRNEQSGSDLAITWGGNFRYNVSDRWCAVADINYLLAKPKFDNYTQKIQVINGAFGIGYRLK